VTRNSETNLIEFNSFAIQGNVVYNLFTNQEWSKITSLKQFSELSAVNWENQGYLLDELFSLLRELIIRADLSQ
jgi:hypothetical protein